MLFAESAPQGGRGRVLIFSYHRMAYLVGLFIHVFANLADLFVVIA